MMRELRRRIAAALCASLVAGCLPPPAKPAAVMPPLAPVPPVPGWSQVALDADEPSVVQVKTGEHESVTSEGGSRGMGFWNSTGGTYVTTNDTYETLCTPTPCAIHLRPGTYDLRITSNRDASHAATGTLTVAQQPVDYRVALGRRHAPSREAGIGVLTAGVVLLFVAGFFASSRSGPGTRADYALGGAGAVGFGTGLWMLFSNSYGGIEQPGAAVQWTPGQ